MRRTPLVEGGSGALRCGLGAGVLGVLGVDRALLRLERVRPLRRSGVRLLRSSTSVLACSSRARLPSFSRIGDEMAALASWRASRSRWARAAALYQRKKNIHKPTIPL